MITIPRLTLQKDYLTTPPSEPMIYQNEGLPQILKIRTIFRWLMFVFQSDLMGISVKLFSSILVEWGILESKYLASREL